MKIINYQFLRYVSILRNEKILSSIGQKRRTIPFLAHDHVFSLILNSCVSLFFFYSCIKRYFGNITLRYKKIYPLTLAVKIHMDI